MTRQQIIQKAEEVGGFLISEFTRTINDLPKKGSTQAETRWVDNKDSFYTWIDDKWYQLPKDE